MNKKMINWENMEQYSLIPMGYRFVDEAEVLPGKEGWGRKSFSSLDWYFRVHFPGNPIVPGVFLMEVLQQTGMLVVTSLPEVSEKILLFHSCESMRMYSSVRPGDMAEAHVVLDSYAHGVAKLHGEVEVSCHSTDERKLVCSMRFTLLNQQEIEKMSSKMTRQGLGK